MSELSQSDSEHFDNPESGRLVGYARVSTDEQKLDVQLNSLTAHGIDPEWIFVEKMSGKSMKRPQLEATLKIMRPGNILVVWKLDRLGRSILGVLNTLEALEKRGIGFRSITESFDTSTPVVRAMLAMAATFAQLERDMISERTKAGVHRAMANGVKFGRRRAMTPARIERYKRLIRESPNMTKKQIVRELQAPEFNPPTISHGSFYNWINDGMPGMAAPSDLDDK